MMLLHMRVDAYQDRCTSTFGFCFTFFVCICIFKRVYGLCDRAFPWKEEQ
uniref:Uncharacterized protein n=1 Tax=Anguilla anguilla TaxID=7936 RepID=A0A0E9PRV4_ANGAN